LDEKGQERLTEKEIKEVQRQKMIGMLEDLLVKKGNDREVQNKDRKISMDDLPRVIQKNLKTLMKHMDSNGISKNDLIKILRNE
jgi:hypothetical protein